MKKIVGKKQVYSEFFTNGAVAWFSAGVIAPLFAKPLGIKGLLGSFMSIFKPESEGR